MTNSTRVAVVGLVNALKEEMVNEVGHRAALTGLDVSTTRNRPGIKIRATFEMNEVIDPE
jgi:hypothetical protein